MESSIRFLRSTSTTNRRVRAVLTLALCVDWPAVRWMSGWRDMDASTVSLSSLWRPGSRRIVAQGLQEDPAERGPLTHGADTRGPLKIAGDAAHQIDACGRQVGEHAGRYVA